MSLQNNVLSTKILKFHFQHNIIIVFPSRNYYSGSKYFSSKIFNNIAIKKWGKKKTKEEEFWTSDYFSFLSVEPSVSYHD